MVQTDSAGQVGFIWEGRWKPLQAKEGTSLIVSIQVAVFAYKNFPVALTVC